MKVISRWAAEYEIRQEVVVKDGDMQGYADVMIQPVTMFNCHFFKDERRSGHERINYLESRMVGKRYESDNEEDSCWLARYT